MGLLHCCVATLSSLPRQACLWDDDETLYPQVLSQVADLLVKRLERRIEVLQDAQLVTDDVMLEIRMQLAESAVAGQLGDCNELMDQVFELLQARELRREV